MQGGTLIFRDYTIAQWDEDTKTCTVFVDAADDGTGSSWVNLLNQNDEITYLKIEKYYYPLKEESRYLFLGDQSMERHFFGVTAAYCKNASVNGSPVIPNPARRKLATYYPYLGLEHADLAGTSSATRKGWLNG